ncbi:hypothetical protein V6N13_092293 [Hibiscus sabdariffa]|uniref:Uncharacterized protein n=1 Tax=Hibiscus sabdariffa TaxID=183260 RepID=A0ABR2CDP7_9ROSI
MGTIASSCLKTSAGHNCFILSENKCRFQAWSSCSMSTIMEIQPITGFTLAHHLTQTPLMFVLVGKTTDDDPSPAAADARLGARYFLGSNPNRLTSTSLIMPTTSVRNLAYH